MLLKGAYCVGEHFVDPHTSFIQFNDYHIRLYDKENGHQQESSCLCITL